LRLKKKDGDKDKGINLRGTEREGDYIKRG